MPWKASRSLTRPLQSCKVSCHGRFQTRPVGLPLRNNIRNKTSNLCWSVLYILGRRAAQTTNDEMTAPKHLIVSHNVARWHFDFWLCACMSEGSPLWGAGNVTPKHQRVEPNFTKSSLQLHPHRRILRKAMPPAHLLKSCVWHEFACPIMPWVLPCSCTTWIPMQHSLDPPVRGQIRNMHRKFPMMVKALFRPSVQSMLLCKCTVKKSKPNYETNLLVTENLFVGKECPWRSL